MATAYNAVLADSAESSIATLLASCLGSEQQGRQPLTETDIRQISESLKHLGKESWSNVPRVYVVLRLIDELQVLDRFIDLSISDIWFPFSHATIPDCFRNLSATSRFLELQEIVLTKALDLEKDNGAHRHFHNEEDIPMRRVGIIGKGAFGVVDHVVSTITHKQYARKLLLRGKTFRNNAQVLANFELELGHLKKLSHIHIVELIGSYTDLKYVGIIMSPVAQCDLKTFLAHDTLTPGRRSFLRSFFGCLAAAICYLHERKIRHKDVKPQNILVKDDKVLLTDFGISLDWSELDLGTTSGITWRTPKYCAPEVANHEPRNSSSDIWSLGCVYLEIWTVLKDETIASLDAYLKSHGTEPEYFFLNHGALTAWCEHLEAQPATHEENPPLKWITSMLQLDRRRRWSAQTLCNHIEEAHASESSLVFSGFCCIMDEDAAESVQFLNRFPRDLEVPDASSVAVNNDKSNASLKGNSALAIKVSLLTIQGASTSLQPAITSLERATTLQPTTFTNTAHAMDADVDAFHLTEYSKPSTPVTELVDTDQPVKRANQNSQENHSFTSNLTDAHQQRRSAKEGTQERKSVAEGNAISPQLLKPAVKPRSSPKSNVSSGSQISETNIHPKNFEDRQNIQSPTSNPKTLWRTAQGDAQNAPVVAAATAKTRSVRLTGPNELVVSDVLGVGTPLIATSSRNVNGNPWNKVTTSQWRTIQGHDRRIYSMALSSSRQLVAAGFEDGIIEIWQLSTESTRRTLKVRNGYVKSLAFSRDGRLLVSLACNSRRHGENLVEIWNSSTGALRHTIRKDTIDPIDGFNVIAFSNDGNLLATGSERGTLEMWDSALDKLRWTLRNQDDEVKSMVFSSDDQRLVSGHRSITIKIWNVATGALCLTLFSYCDCICSVAFSSDDQLLASASRNGTITLWDPGTGLIRRTYKSRALVDFLAFSNDSQLLVLGVRDAIKLWNPVTGSLLHTLPLLDQGGAPHSVACSSNNQLLASASSNGTIHLWNIVRIDDQ